MGLTPLIESTNQPIFITFDMKKLPSQALHLLIPFFLSFAMSGVISLISTLRAIGFSGFVFSDYVVTWFFAWAVGFPVVLVILPIARKIALLFVDLKKT